MTDVLAIIDEAIRQTELEQQDAIATLAGLDDYLDRLQRARAILANVLPTLDPPNPDELPTVEMPESGHMLMPPGTVLLDGANIVTHGHPYLGDGADLLARAGVEAPSEAATDDDKAAPEPATDENPVLELFRQANPYRRLDNDEVLAALEGLGGSAVIVDIRDALGVPTHQPVLGRLRSLLAEGRVEQTGKTWAVIPDPAPTSPDTDDDEADHPPPIVQRTLEQEEADEHAAETTPHSRPTPPPARPTPTTQPVNPVIDRDKLAELVTTYGEDEGITVRAIVELLPWSVTSRIESDLDVYHALEVLATEGRVERRRAGRWRALAAESPPGTPAHL